jgi:hypothetical protein
MELSPWEATSCSAAEEFLYILCNWRFNTVFTRTLHWSLSWVSSIQSIPPYSMSLRSILLLSSHLYYRVSCRSLFRELNFSTVTYLYIFEILCFIIKNKIYTTQYSEVYGYNTIHKHNLYVKFCKTECSKRGVIMYWYFIVIRCCVNIMLFWVMLLLFDMSNCNSLQLWMK